MIYFIRVTPDGAIKIGQTINLTKRLESYVRLFGPTVDVLGVMPGGRKAEKAILERFDHLRTSKSVVSEWRTAQADLMQYIRDYTSPWGGKDDLPASKQEVIAFYKADSSIAPAIKQWLGELADFLCVPIPVLFDQALSEFARNKGFTKRKPRRQIRKRRAV